MVKRLWFVLSALWAVVFLGNGMTKVSGIQPGDVYLAMTPAIAGPVLVAVGRWIARG